MNELKPCIRCGGHMSWNDNEFESVYVCDDCHYFIEWDGTPEEFVKWWNTRPIEDALTARIVELEAEVTKCHELQDSYCDRIAKLEGLLSRMAKAGDGLTMNPHVSDYAERERAWNQVWLEWKKGV